MRKIESLKDTYHSCSLKALVNFLMFLIAFLEEPPEWNQSSEDFEALACYSHYLSSSVVTQLQLSFSLVYLSVCSPPVDVEQN